MCCSTRPLKRFVPRLIVAILGAFLVVRAPIANAADAPAAQQRPILKPPSQLQANVPATHLEPVREKPLILTAPHSTAITGEKATGGSHTAGAMVTVAISLAIVLGLFWICAWLMRRGLPNTARRLPGEVVEVLGRAPLAGRQQMHLLRFGNKLLLVCASPSGIDTLSEITDAAEIDRLAGLCEQQQPQSATTAFKQIFGQLSGDRSVTVRVGRKLADAEEAADA